MTFKIVAKFFYRSSNIDEKYFEKIVKQPLPFDNCEYELRISGTVDTDLRIMSFVDILWGFEVTGGSDQFEPLVIIDMKRAGYAFRAGMRVGDIITRINNIYTDDMTLLEAQLLIQKSGKSVRIFVRGNAKIEEDDEFTVDFWFKPRKRFPPIHIENKWTGRFPWNDRQKPIYKESNCYMVPSKAEVRMQTHRRKQVVSVCEDNETTSYGETHGDVSDGHIENGSTAVNEVNPSNDETNHLSNGAPNEGT